MYLSKFSLEGKVAVVTGGGTGIGRAIALTFADAGADIVVSSRKQENLEEVAEEVRQRGRKALVVATHLGKIENMNMLTQRVVEEFGKVDILVNNAATNPVQEPLLSEAQSERLWEAIMNLNLKCPFFLSRAMAEIMKEHGGGNIIHIASMEGFVPGDGTCMYDITKAGLLQLTRAQAREWAQFNIRVNAVAPGTVKTNMSRMAWQNSVEMEKWNRHIPMRRFGEPEEMAFAALYFASDASSYTTGASIIADGGVLAVGWNPNSELVTDARLAGPFTSPPI